MESRAFYSKCSTKRKRQLNNLLKKLTANLYTI